MKPERAGAGCPAIPGAPAAVVGALCGVVVRCMGCAVVGAVFVAGGAE
jgi:hypothetical protein